MKYTSRAEVESMLVQDEYFEDKHVFLKTKQTIMAIIGWLGVVLPFIWVLTPLFFPQLTISHYFMTYLEEMMTLNFLVIFLLGAFIFIAVLYVALTFWNNHRFKTSLRKGKTYDEARLEKRKAVLETAYEKRFGEKNFRTEVKYYEVKEEQNLETGFVSQLYRENGVKL